MFVIIWKCQQEAFDYIQNLDIRFNLYILKKLVAFWMLTTLIPTLVLFQFVYSIESMSLSYRDDLLVAAFNLLPNNIQLIFEENSFVLTIVLIALALVQLFLKKTSILTSFLLFVLFNFHLCLTSDINSGATAIIANVSAYIVVFDILTSIQFRNKTLINFVFIALQFQMLIVYLVAGLVKLFSPIWMGGSATYYIFNNHRYFKLISLIEPMKDFDLFWILSSYLPILFLLSFPLLIYSRFRRAALWTSFVFHSIIAISMGLKEFMIFPLLDFIIFSNKDVLENNLKKISEKLNWPTFKLRRV